MFEQFIYLSLGLISFFIVNSVGKILKGRGYEVIEFEESKDNLPGFNLIFRIVFPILLIIFYAYFISLTYYQYLNKNLYYVNYYYLVIRFTHTILFGNYLLLNLPRQIIIYISIIILNEIICDNYIFNISKLFPNFDNFINEIWLLIILFIYKLTNEITVNNEKIDERKSKFILYRFNYFYKKYAKIIKQNKGFPFIFEIFSIMIYEDYNRPYSFRWLERCLKFFKFNIKTTGIMQITSTQTLSDKKSIFKAIKEFRKKYSESLFDTYYDKKEPFYYQKETADFFDEFINLYNIHSTYSEQIYFIYSTIVESEKAKDFSKIMNMKKKIGLYVKIREIKHKRNSGINIDEPSLNYLQTELKKLDCV